MLTKIIIPILLLTFAHNLPAKEIKIIETDSAEIEVRVFPGKGNVLLLGFPCDEGKSQAEEKTALSLSQDGIEVWMPDMLSGFMLPKVKSSLSEIPTDALVRMIDAATKTGKQVYLVASGPDTELILRGINHWEAKMASEKGSKEATNKSLAGVILMFPRLFKKTPIPGKKPEYINAVGKSKLPMVLLEGERTPNRWGVNLLKKALEKGGSDVIVKVIPKVRGYFFKRQDANRSESIVTAQMAGLIKVSLFYLGADVVN